MNKTLTIATIALVAVVMGMSAVAPMLPEAFAHNVPDTGDDKAHEICQTIHFRETRAYSTICTH